jgi:hypothetical protein
MVHEQQFRKIPYVERRLWLRTRIVAFSPSVFSMPAPDAKTRNKISLSPRVFSTSIPPKHLPRIFVASVLYATALHAGKGLLDFDVGVFWVVMRVLACAGFGVLVWEARTGQLAKRKSIEVCNTFRAQPPSLISLPISVVGPRDCFFASFCSAGMPIHRAVQTAFYSVCSCPSFGVHSLLLSEQCGPIHSFLDPLAQYTVDHIHGTFTACFLPALITLTASENFGRYTRLGALYCIRHPILHREHLAVCPGLRCPARPLINIERTGPDSRYSGPISGIHVHHCRKCSGCIRLCTAVLCLQNSRSECANRRALHCSSVLQLEFPSTPVLPIASLIAIPFLAFSLLFFSPITARSLSHLSFTPQHFMLAYPSTSVFAAVFGSLAFSQFSTWTDAAVAILLYMGMSLHMKSRTGHANLLYQVCNRRKSMLSLPPRALPRRDSSGRTSRLSCRIQSRARSSTF